MQRLRQLIKSVDLDTNGVFKYIQIRLTATGNNPDSEAVTLVRGYLECDYHADILEKFEREELNANEELSQQWQAECPGGGRIQVNETEKQLLIYGYSQGYGRCDHTLTQTLIQEQMPDYDVTWSNEGY